MESGMSQTAERKPSLEQRSETIKSLAREIRVNIEDFLETGKTEPNMKAIPTPQLDALSQIEDNLVCAEQIMKSALEFFIRLKARIRS